MRPPFTLHPTRLLPAAVVVILGVVTWIEIRRDHPSSQTSVVTQAKRRATSLLVPILKLRQDGQIDEALQAVETVLSAEPRFLEAHLLRAELLHQLHRADEMIPSLEAAIQIDPESFDAHANLAFALRYAGRLEDAERETAWCLTRDSMHVAVRRIVAEIRRDRGDVESALQGVQAILKKVPDDLDTRIMEAELFLFKRQPKLAYDRLKPLAAAQPVNPRLLTTLARAAASVGRPEEAARYRAAAQANLR